MNPRYTYKNRHGTYYFRYVVTKNGERTEFRFSLKTQDRNQARIGAMRSWVVVTQSISKGVHSSRIIRQIIKNSIDQMHNTTMSNTPNEILQIGPDLVSVVDIAGTRDLASLQDLIAYAHSKGGYIHAPFGSGECTFFELYDEEYEEPPIYPFEKSQFVSSNVVLTDESVQRAISSTNGYFEYTNFLSYAPGGWKRAVGFTCTIVPPKPMGVKVIQLSLEKDFANSLNLESSGCVTRESSEYGLISEELERFGKEKIRAEDWTEKTLSNYQSIFDTFVEIIGDKPVADINRADVKRYLDVLDTLPLNRNKVEPFRNMDAISASELNAKLGGTTLNKRTKNNYIKRLSEPFDEFVEDEIFNHNFFRSAKGYNVKDEEKFEARDPWSTEDIETMIESEKAIQMLSKSKTAVSKPWALLICMFTGARISEILSLPLDGVGWEDGVPYFDIKKRSGHNRLKKPASKRKIPIHPTLINLGFLDYLDQAKKVQKNATTPMLFTDVHKTVNHGWGRQTKDWYNNSFYVKLGIKSEKTVTHSFRHNISDFFRRANGINQLKASAYIGQADKRGKPEWQNAYGSPFSPKELIEITDFIKYDVDFSRLKSQCLDRLKPRLDRNNRNPS